MCIETGEWMLATEVRIIGIEKHRMDLCRRGEGRNFQIEAVSADFESMTRVKRQQAVLRLIPMKLLMGSCARSRPALTPEEKSKRQGLGI